MLRKVKVEKKSLGGNFKMFNEYENWGLGIQFSVRALVYPAQGLGFTPQHHKKIQINIIKCCAKEDIQKNIWLAYKRKQKQTKLTSALGS
jgi:hypothetical protein